MSRLIRAAAVAASIATVIGTAALGTAAAQAAPGAASPATALRWKLAFHHQYGTAGSPYSEFDAVLAPARNDAWVFGEAGDPSHATAVAARWNGHRWRTVALGSGPAGQIGAVSAVSRDDIWAAGFLNQDILRWNGRAWSVVHHWPGSGAEITGISVISPADVWVFGGPGYTRGLGTWHYNGHTWKRFTGNAAYLEGGSVVSARDIWAIGGTTKVPHNILVRYDGHRWVRVTAPALRNGDFTDIAAVSRSSVWVTGEAGTTHPRGVLLHWNGRSWRRLSVPGGLEPDIVLPSGGGGLWLTAHSASSYLLYRSAAGAWTRKRLGSQSAAYVYGLARIPGTSAVWGTSSIPQGSGFAAAVYRGSRS